jgi:riboflavin synthase
VFTGLVQTTGVVRDVQRSSGAEGHRAESVRVEIAATLADADRILGASVCVSGVCLTVVDSSPEWFAADLGFETLAITTFGQASTAGAQGLAIGTRVNLEPSLRLGDALGGHMVSGHVDGIAQIRSVEPRGDAREVWIDVPEPLRRFIAVKGSVAVDGVSLTVNRVDASGFMVGLIPHTLAVTTLGDTLERLGSVNLEVDTVARYVERLLQFSSSASSDSDKDQHD